MEYIRIGQKLVQKTPNISLHSTARMMYEPERYNLIHVRSLK